MLHLYLKLSKQKTIIIYWADFGTTRHNFFFRTWKRKFEEGEKYGEMRAREGVITYQNIVYSFLTDV